MGMCYMCSTKAYKWFVVVVIIIITPDIVLKRAMRLSHLTGSLSSEWLPRHRINKCWYALKIIVFPMIRSIA